MKEKDQGQVGQISLFDQDEGQSPSNKKEGKQEKSEISKKEMVILPNREVLQTTIPAAVLKNRSNLINDVIDSEFLEIMEKESCEVVGEEKENLFPLNVTTRFSLSYEEYEGLNVKISKKLNQFDREVMDAVATLAPHMSVLSAATIYRVITGKPQDYPVMKSQKVRVATSMEKCRSCLINIDVTEEFKEHYNIGPKETVRFNEYLISYSELCHKTSNGDNIFYEIMKMPPLFRFAESIGKISKIPLRLLDTPLSKTDGILSMQSFLLRSIEDMKCSSKKEISIQWIQVYYYADASEGDRVQKKRVRDNTKKVLNWWKEQGYISSFVIDIKKNPHLIIFN